MPLTELQLMTNVSQDTIKALNFITIALLLLAASGAYSTGDGYLSGCPFDLCANMQQNCRNRFSKFWLKFLAKFSAVGLSHLTGLL